MATTEKFYIEKPIDGTRLSTTGSFGWVIDPDDSSTIGDYLVNSKIVKTD